MMIWPGQYAAIWNPNGRQARTNKDTYFDDGSKCREILGRFWKELWTISNANNSEIRLQAVRAN